MRRAIRWGLGAALAMLAAAPLQAQVLEWARCYDGPGGDYDDATALAVDEAGFVYVTGGSRGAGTDFDYATIKYTREGDTLWVRRHELGEFALGRAVLPDAEGNVYVTGGPLTLKYDAEGDLLWSYDQGGELTRLAFDPEGHIVAAGTSLERFQTIELDPSGSLRWEALYRSPGNRGELHDLALDSAGDVIVTGGSRGVDSFLDYATIKYDGATGDTLWVRRYAGPAPFPDVPTDFANAVALDGEDNVYVAGWSDDADNRNDCLTIKYSPEGEELWQHRYPEGSVLAAACHDLLVVEGPEGDPEGEALYAAAAGTGGDTLLRYDLDGKLLWTRFYAHDAIFATTPRRLAADSDGNVYMTSVTDGTLAQLVVLKYTPEGERLWEYLYPGEGQNTTSNTRALVVDAADNVYVTGGNVGPECPGASYDYLTLKLSQPPVSSEEEAGAPSGVALGPSYPNPARGSAVIPYRLGATGHVRLVVYDVLGRAVALLVDGPQGAGAHEARFGASGLASGVYLVRLEAGGVAATRRLGVLR